VGFFPERAPGDRDASAFVLEAILESRNHPGKSRYKAVTFAIGARALAWAIARQIGTGTF
jgi:hypothetical protein